MSMREEIEEWIDSYERLLEENKKMKSVIQFWRKKWIEEQKIPAYYDEDRKQRITSIFLMRNVLSTDPENDLQEACKTFDSCPRVGE